MSIRDLDGRRGRPGVASDVRQRLLHDPERRHVDPEGQRTNLADGLGPDRQARGGSPGDEVVQPCQGGRWGPAGLLVALAEDVEHRAELGQGLLAGLPDGVQCRAGLLGKFLVEVECHPRPHVDQRDVVAERVVQLAGHPETLLARPAASLLLSNPGGLKQRSLRTRTNSGPAEGPMPLQRLLASGRRRPVRRAAACAGRPRRLHLRPPRRLGRAPPPRPHSASSPPARPAGPRPR